MAVDPMTLRMVGNMGKLKKFLDNPYIVFRQPRVLDCMRWVNDDIYLKLEFRARMGQRLDLENPRSFNEKLQWLKLHDRNPLYHTLVDKYAVKGWVADMIGEEYVTKTYGCWESVDDIDLSLLPEQFVLKTNHDCGGIAICRDRNEFDFEAAKKLLDDHLHTNYYWRTREWPYKDVKPLVFAEEYLEPDTGDGDLRDYKFLCFGGKPALIELHKGRFGLHVQDIYDTEWKRVEISDWGYPQSEDVEERPAHFDDMVAFSEKLASDFPHVRVDWYSARGSLYFGEMTFYDGAGFCAFEDYADDLKLGSWIKLPGGGSLIVNDYFVLHVFPACKESSREMVDYKFYCFDGEPEFLYVSKGLEFHETARISFLEKDWSFAPFVRDDYAPFERLPEKPNCYDEMLGLSRVLSAGMPFVRADFFEYRGKPRFSEMTFCPCAGYMHFEPAEWDEHVGDLLDLSRC